ncbi:hypothetical protein HYV80_00680 [Candidatus Woesearchaeota archaeon]|nr:hypothetical protein [Candidatus Woesearchaeota archaeon]
MNQINTKRLAELTQDALGPEYIAKALDASLITIFPAGAAKPEPFADVYNTNGNKTKIIDVFVRDLPPSAHQAILRVVRQYRAADLEVLGVDVRPYGMH